MNPVLTRLLYPPIKPMLKFCGVPVDATLAIVLTHITIMVLLVLSSFLMPTVTGGQDGNLLIFSIFNTETFQFHQPLSLFLYPFLHDIRSEHVFFLVEMLLLFVCGRQLEALIGRKSYIFLQATLLIVPPLLLLSLSKVIPVSFILSSSFYTTMVLCLTYLMIVPKPRAYAGLSLAVMTWLLVGFCLIFFLAERDWRRLANFSMTLMAALVFIEVIGAGKGAGILYFFKAVPEENNSIFKKVKSLVSDELVPVCDQQTVDTILDKISLSGIDSLNREERKGLADASQRLQRND